MVKDCEKYWWKRATLIEAINNSGGKYPLSVACKNIFYSGASLNNVINELEKRGFIIKVKGNRSINTYLTENGKQLLDIIKKLKMVWNSDN